MTGRRGKVFIITGMSGAGRSQALKSFEDFGFYCVDNLPLALLRNFALLVRKNRQHGNIALGIDVREGRALKDLPSTIKNLRKEGFDFRIVFLDAADSVLLHRFSETRHRHPLHSNIARAISQERKILSDLRGLADKEIDTTKMTLGELKETLSGLLELKQSREMQLSVISFGYKYGLPLDADLVMDVRFLSNPNYIKSLKYKTGLDKPVAAFVEKDRRTGEFLKRFIGLIEYLVPLYIREGKSYLTIAIGCTGGRHRSVFIAHKLSQTLRKSGFSVSEFHKDMKRQ